MQNPHWLDFIGRPDFNFYKTGTTREYDSRYKDKYSPNRSLSYYRDPHPKRNRVSSGKREVDKILTRKIIQEYYEDRGNYTEE
jgi:hypothetical protein